MKFVIYGKKEAGTGEHSNTFNNQINKQQNSGSPSRTTAANKTQTKIQAWSSLVFQCRHSSFYSFRSSSVGLETGEWRRCRSLSFTPPASLRSHGSRPRPTRHIPPSPLAGRGVLTRLRSTPPLPPLPGGARQGGRGVPGGKDRRGERKETEGWGVTETREGREEKKKKKSRSGSQTHCRSVLNQLSGSLAVPCDGTGPLWWTARCSSASWRTAVAPPVEGSRQRVPRSLLLPKHGGWQQASASRRTGRLLRSLSDGSHPSSTQEHGSESSVPPVLLLLQHHRFGQPLAVSATSCCPIFSAPRSHSAARSLWQRVPPSSRASAPM